ncbi:YHS domain-containing protein [Candidatus Giovannonibacteria bacterium]|nr:YHS domain-containing protein [Candidatus Giovannonibacteria bacterium]
MLKGEEKIGGHRDPVCGMQVDPEKTKFSAKQGDEICYFCSEYCYKRFLAEPEKFTAEAEKEEE